jgi:hypothetical protein
VVPPDSHRISRARCYLGTRSRDNAFSCTGLSPSAATPSRGLPLTTLFSHSPSSRQKRLNGPTTPPPQRLPALTWKRFSLLRFRSPLLTESRLFSLPVGTEMFHFPTFPPHALCVQARVTPHDWCGVPPFGHPRINARLAAPRGLSQPPTSFIGSWCPGIHRVPLTTWPHNHNTPHPHRRRGPRSTHPNRGPCSSGSTRDGAARSAYTIKRCSRPLCSSQRPTGHPPDPPPPNPTPVRTRTQQMHPIDGRYEDPDGPDTRHRPHPRLAPATGPLPQDPTACLRPAVPTHRVPRPPPRAVLAAAEHQPAELVSVPPSEHHPSNPRPTTAGGPSRAGRGSAPPPRPGRWRDAP